MTSLKILVGTILLLALSIPLTGQTAEWVNTQGSQKDDEAYAIYISESQMIYMAGYFQETVNFGAINSLTSNGGNDVFLQCLDTNGIILWTTTMGGLGNDVANYLYCDKDENIYIIGEFENTVSWSPSISMDSSISAGGTDIFLCKYTKNGNYVWSKTFGGIGNDYGYSIHIDDSKVYITGSFSNSMTIDSAKTDTLTSKGNADPFVICMDTAGQVQWGKSWGGTGNDWGFGVQSDGSNGIVVTGQFNSKVDFNPGVDTAYFTGKGFADGFILKLDTTGNYVWNKVIEGLDFEACFETRFDSYGNMYVTGLFTEADLDPGPDTLMYTSAGMFDMFLLKLDANGNMKWVRKKGVPGWDLAQSINLDSEENIYISGNYRPTGKDEIVVYKFDSTGTPIWKYNPDSGRGPNIAVRIALVRENKFVICGYMSDTVDFNSYNPLSPLLTVSKGGKDIFVSKIFVEESTISIPEMYEGNLLVYPNPTYNHLYIKTPYPVKQLKIALYDLTSRKIDSVKPSLLTQNLVSLDLKKIPQGMYLLSIENLLDHSIEVRKILVQN